MRANYPNVTRMQWAHVRACMGVITGRGGANLSVLTRAVNLHRGPTRWLVPGPNSTLYGPAR